MTTGLYELLKLDLGGLQKVRQEWKGRVEEDAFVLEMGQMFDYAQSMIAGQSSDAPDFFALSDVASGKTHALLDIIKGTKSHSSLTKLLKVVLSPDYWEDSTQAAVIFAEAVVQTITHGIETAIGSNPSNGFIVKIYGRNEALLDILLSTYKQLESKKLQHLKVSMQGRWLCVEDNIEVKNES